MRLSDFVPSLFYEIKRFKAFCSWNIRLLSSWWSLHFSWENRKHKLFLPCEKCYQGTKERYKIENNVTRVGTPTNLGRLVRKGFWEGDIWRDIWRIRSQIYEEVGNSIPYGANTMDKRPWGKREFELFKEVKVSFWASWGRGRVAFDLAVQEGRVRWYRAS